ncbi:germ cell-specific gene 1-like protein [Platichthys flesus]|uniref:germ cell-specific gene 1-like protein n=1 Tax=Platichthys flesus TaxID=8260 RepID=UPI002DBE5F98|nr:germ cell-specific gene 1-like protein [Platichthys flesus]
MELLQRMRSPRLSFVQTLVSLFLGGTALMSSYWCEGKQKVPKPLCTATKHTSCIPVPGVSNSNIQFSWETGDDRFVFPTFHTGLFVTCEENIYADSWEEKCRGFYTLTPRSEKAMMWLSLSLELLYVGLLLISCTLLSVQLGMRAWGPSTQRWGQLLNSFAAVFTVLGGLLGMVGHMMFMQVFQTTATMGPEDFKPHSYGYSWAFYVAWFAFTVCMSAGVSTLNNYTKKVLMEGPRPLFNAWTFSSVGLLPPAPHYAPPNAAITLASPPSPPRISHLSPYYAPASTKLPASVSRLTYSRSLPLPHSESFPPHPSSPAPASPFHRLSLPSTSPSPVASVSVRMALPAHREHPFEPGDDYSPL